MTDETRIARGDEVVIRGRVRNTWVDADIRHGTRMAELELLNGGRVMVAVAELERAKAQGDERD